MLSTVLTLLKIGSTKPKPKPDSPPPASYAQLVVDLETWVNSDRSRRKRFDTAIHTAHDRNTPHLRNIHCLEDYLHLLDDQLHWIPSETVRPKDLLFRTLAIWFVLDQDSVLPYQSPIQPCLGLKQRKVEGLTWLSKWMIQFSNEIGQFMDTPGSASAVDTFRQTASYNLDQYVEPRGGWKTFNEFFSRQVKPGRRPIAAIGDSSIVTSPVDFQFQELHPIAADSTVTTKALTWPVVQILDDSPYGDRFSNGIWLHGFLDLDDYHRVHTPVSGTVLEARVIPGQNYMQVEPSTSDQNVETDLAVPNAMGYQFCQSRGLIVIDTGAGLVAVLPVGMAIVSSVILTAEVGATLHKGEELGYFQFGGSDCVLIFEACLKVRITVEQGEHYQMGSQIGSFTL
ncbi:phosphatidylserine decarboxylase-domain-containing protein [Aspergillus californicus]